MPTSIPAYSRPEVINNIDRLCNRIETQLQRSIMLKVTDGLGYSTLDFLEKQESKIGLEALEQKLLAMEELTSGKDSRYLQIFDLRAYLRLRSTERDRELGPDSSGFAFHYGFSF